MHRALQTCRGAARSSMRARERSRIRETTERKASARCHPGSINWRGIGRGGTARFAWLRGDRDELPVTDVSLDAIEREALCDLMNELGPDAPTLVAPWTTHDLAAHLVIREHDYRAAPGLVVPGAWG